LHREVALISTDLWHPTYPLHGQLFGLVELCHTLLSAYWQYCGASAGHRYCSHTT